MSSVKTAPAKTELSLSNIDSARFTKDDFDPSNDLKVSLRIKPQKVRSVRRMLLFTVLSSATLTAKLPKLAEAYREHQRRREGTFVQLLNVPRYIE